MAGVWLESAIAAQCCVDDLLRTADAHASRVSSRSSLDRWAGVAGNFWNKILVPVSWRLGRLRSVSSLGLGAGAVWSGWPLRIRAESQPCVHFRIRPVSRVVSQQHRRIYGGVEAPRVLSISRATSYRTIKFTSREYLGLQSADILILLRRYCGYTTSTPRISKWRASDHYITETRRRLSHKAELPQPGQSYKWTTSSPRIITSLLSSLELEILIFESLPILLRIQ